MSTAHHRDYTGAKIGMWLFLFSEFFLFFGPFLLYSIFRYRYPAEFASASRELDVSIGTINTIILITGSLFVALSVTALQRGKRLASVILLSLTFISGAVFLFNKYGEWMAKIAHGLYPGSAALGGRPPGEGVFFGLYFFMTGIHGLHVIAGMCAVLFTALLIFDGKVTGSDPIKLENAGLYWHLVDVIWIFLFPVFYLVR